MPSKKEYTSFSLPYLMLLVLTTLTGCSSDLDPTPSATTGDNEPPEFKAVISADTSRDASGRVTQVFVSLFDVSGSDDTSISLIEGDTLSATTTFSGKAYDFSNHIEDWSAAIISDTDATATVERDSETESLQLNPTWDDATSDIIAVVAGLYRPVDFNAADLSLEINVPQAYVTDGRMQIRVFLRDEERVDAFLDLINVSELTGGNWYTIDISNINSSLLQADTGFDLRSVRFVGVQFISNGKAVDIDDSILIDNVVVTVTPMEQTNSLTWNTETNAFSFGRLSNNELVYVTQFNGGLSGQPLTITVNRVTAPDDTHWFPDNDSPAPNFSDYMFIATDNTIDLPPDIEITAPKTYDADSNNVKYEVGVDEVMLEWEPAGSLDAITINYQSDCEAGVATGSIEHEAGDTGAATYPIESFLAEQVVGTAKLYEILECNISISLSRDTEGSMDPVFSNDSTITAALRSYPILVISKPPSNS